MGTINRRVIRWATFWVSALLVIQRAGELLKSVFLARWFSKEEMGMVAILLMLHRGIEAFTQMGHEAALVQRPDADLDEAIDTAFVSGIGRGIFLAALVAFSAAAVADFYREPKLTMFLAVSGALFVVNGLRNLAMVKMTRNVDLKHPKLVLAYGAVTDVVLTVGSALASIGIWCVVIGRVAGGLATAIATHVVAPRRVRFRFSTERFKELFRYGVNIQGIAILMFLVTQMDDAVVGRVLGLDELAVYVIAYTMATLPVSNVVAIASEVAFPTWAAVARGGDIKARNKMFVDTLRFCWGLSIALAVALVAGGEDLIALIFGDKWRPAAQPLTILVGISVARTLSGTFGALFNASGKPHITLREVIARVVLIAALLIPLTRQWGLIGASWAVTGPMLAIMPIATWFYARISGIGMGPLMQALWRPIVAGSFAWAGIFALRELPAWNGLPSPVKGIAGTAIALLIVIGFTAAADAKFRRFVWRRKEA